MIFTQMHQRHPIRIDKDRAFSAKNGPVSSSTQVSFHKIYRKKRCYSLADKEQEGHTGSQSKAGFVSSQRDNSAGLRSNYSFGSSILKPTRRTDYVQSNNSCSYSVSPPNSLNYSSGSSSFKPTRRIDYVQSNKSSSYSASPSNRECAKSYRHHFLKRPNDRLGCNSVSGPEVDVPFVKRQKVENYKFPALQHNVSPETGQGKEKMLLDDTKWMYKNQHAKMSGPYGVRQLMEGFHARFLQEDLPVYQFHEGKLCKPIMLKQLIDDLESCNSPMHNPRRHFDHSFVEESFCQVAPRGSPCKIDDMDLPPGFGGRSAPLSERPSCTHVPNSPALATGPQRSVGAFPPALPDFGVAEFGLPPGFEAGAGTVSLIEPHITELLGSSRRLSTGAGVATRSVGEQGMQLSYEKFEPVVHGHVHSSHQGSSPASFMMQERKSSSDNSMQLEPIMHGQVHSSQQGSSLPSKVDFTLQGARNLNENSSRHTTWALASPNMRGSNIEAQIFSSPTVCIGLPVSKPAVQNWSVPNNLPIAYVQTNNGLLPKEYSEFSFRHGSDPLALIHLELLAAVKRSYIKTVLSALIDEQLKCWIDSKGTMTKLLLAEDGSLSREASSLTSAEFGVDSNAFQTDASTALTGSTEASLQVRAAQCSDGSRLDAHVGSAETSLKVRASQCVDGSGAQIGEHQRPSAEASSMRKDGNVHATFVMTDARSLSDTEQKSLGTSEVHDLEKAESFLSIDEGSILSMKSSSLLGNNFDNSKQVFVNHTEEVQHQSGDEIPQENGAFVEHVQSSGNTSDAVLLETEPSFLVSGKKKWNIKSLKLLMQITSKLGPKHSKISLSKNKKEKTVCGMVPKVFERRMQNEVLILKDYDGCARTSVDGWLWRKLVLRAPHSKGFQARDCRFFRIQLNAQTARTHRAQLRQLPAATKLTQSEAKLKLARSKIHGWGIFAVESVETGDFVIEYVGEVVRPRISDIREQHYKNLGIGSSYLFRVDDEMVVDATKCGGLARFMNYSCDPNCSAKIVTVEGSKKVYIYAKRHISAGEELTYDCKFQLEDPKVPCNCGSIRCRGSLN